MTAVENPRPDQVPRQPSRNMWRCSKRSFRDQAINKVDAEESQETDCESIVYVHGKSSAEQVNLWDGETTRGE